MADDELRLRFPFRRLPAYFWRPRLVDDPAQPENGAVGTVQVGLSVRLSKLGSSFFGHFEHCVSVGERNKSDKLSRDVGQGGDLLLKFGDSGRESAAAVFHAADLLTFRRTVLHELGGVTDRPGR